MLVRGPITVSLVHKLSLGVGQDGAKRLGELQEKEKKLRFLRRFLRRFSRKKKKEKKKRERTYVPHGYPNNQEQAET